MKKWSSHARFSFQNTIHWCQNLLLLNYSYAFEILAENFWFTIDELAMKLFSVSVSDRPVSYLMHAFHIKL